MNKHNLGLAAVLSFFIPGLGQIYKGQILRGLVYMGFISLCYWSVVLIPLGLLCHLFVMIGAYQD